VTIIGLAPISLKDAVLTVDGDDFTASVSEVSFVPEVDYEWLPLGFGGRQTPVPSGTRWVVMVSYAQDFDTADGFTRYLYANAGSMQSLTFTPKDGSSAAVSGSALIVPGKLGGSATDATLTAQVVLPLDGEPVLV